MREKVWKTQLCVFVTKRGCGQFDDVLQLGPSRDTTWSGICSRLRTSTECRCVSASSPTVCLMSRLQYQIWTTRKEIKPNGGGKKKNPDPDPWNAASMQIPVNAITSCLHVKQIREDFTAANRQRNSFTTGKHITEKHLKKKNGQKKGCRKIAWKRSAVWSRLSRRPASLLPTAAAAVMNPL